MQPTLFCQITQKTGYWLVKIPLVLQEVPWNLWENLEHGIDSGNNQVRNSTQKLGNTCCTNFFNGISDNSAVKPKEKKLNLHSTATLNWIITTQLKLTDTFFL